MGGQCPECAAPVADALRGEYLRYADGEWLERVVRGVNGMWIGVVGLVATQVLLLIGLGLPAVSELQDNSTFAFLRILAYQFALLSSLAVLWGTWEATALTNSSGATQRPLLASAILVRTVLVFLAGGAAGIGALWAFNGRGWLATVRVTELFVLAFAFAIVFAAFTLQHLQRLLKRTPAAAPIIGRVARGAIYAAAALAAPLVVHVFVPAWFTGVTDAIAGLTAGAVLTSTLVIPPIMLTYLFTLRSAVRAELRVHQLRAMRRAAV